MKKEEEIEKVPRCTICNHPDREGIELLGMLSAASWNIATTRINNTFNTNFTKETVRKHMTTHELHRAAMEQGVIIDSIRGEDGSSPIISVETMLQTMLVQGMLDLAKGKIRCKNTGELLQVVNTLRNLQASKEQKMALENGDVQGFYAAMAAYGTALRDTLSPQQLVEVIAKANALGAVLDISNIPLEMPIEIEPQDVMQQAVNDYKQLGHSRTRDELITAGVIKELEEQIELP